MTVTSAARKRAGAYSEVSAIKQGVAPPKTQSRQHPEGDQHGNGRGKCRQDGENTDQHGGNDQQRLASETIGERPERGRSKRRSDQRGGKNPFEVGDRDAELVGDERRRDTD